MSRRNVEVVRRSYEAFNRGDLEAALRPLADDVVWDDSERSGIYHGREGVRQFFAEVLDAWQSYRLEPEEYIDAGESVVVMFRNIGRGIDSGIEVEMRLSAVITFAGDEIAHTKVYSERAAALEAAGVQV